MLPHRIDLAADSLCSPGVLRPADTLA